MNDDNKRLLSHSRKREALKRKIHRALLEARNAQYRGDHETTRAIVKKIMAEAAPAAYEASKDGAYNWVVEALKPLDDLLLPDDQ